MTPNARRRLLWLIGGRAVVVTLLLGSAIVSQIKGPGSPAIDPFFFLIGLTYGLTVVYICCFARPSSGDGWSTSSSPATRSSSRRWST